MGSHVCWSVEALEKLQGIFEGYFEETLRSGVNSTCIEIGFEIRCATMRVGTLLILEGPLI